MDHANTPSAAPTVRHDGWTETRRARFLEHLAGRGNVRAACASVAMSPEAAYRLRRRDPLFARAWAAALALAREACADVFACRAIDGVEEEVRYRGEVVGTRRRYDTRLLLAHMARLDALAESGSAREDAGRFDELVALVAGLAPPEDLACDENGLPRSREASVALAMDIAAEIARDEAELAGEGAELSPAERFAAGAEAAAAWDAWVDRARATVDRLAGHSAGGDSFARTPSNPSTSPLADGPARGQPAALG